MFSIAFGLHGLYRGAFLSAKGVSTPSTVAYHTVAAAPVAASQVIRRSITLGSQGWIYIYKYIYIYTYRTKIQSLLNFEGWTLLQLTSSSNSPQTAGCCLLLVHHRNMAINIMRRLAVAAPPLRRTNASNLPCRASSNLWHGHNDPR